MGLGILVLSPWRPTNPISGRSPSGHLGNSGLQPQASYLLVTLKLGNGRYS